MANRAYRALRLLVALSVVMGFVSSLGTGFVSSLGTGQS